MLQLQNQTPFAANISLLPDEQGIDTLYVIARATFKLGKQWTLAEEQPMPTEADEYYGEPGLSSIKYPSDYHLGKVATDILMLGDACAPEGKQATALDVQLNVGSIGKTVKVFGNRAWQGGQITQAETFERMPLRYESAYGGEYKNEEGHVVSSELRNPLGKAYIGKGKAQEFDGKPLPNLEHPSQLIRVLGDVSEPAGFGPIAPNWHPRVEFSGTYDDEWTQHRAPFVPLDFDKRFFNCAPTDLIYPGFIQGGESVSIRHMHPAGDLQFQLPIVNVAGRVSIGSTETSLKFNCETLLLEPNDLQVSMVWRAAVPAGKAISKITAIEMFLARNQEVA